MVTINVQAYINRARQLSVSVHRFVDDITAGRATPQEIIQEKHNFERLAHDLGELKTWIGAQGTVVQGNLDQLRTELVAFGNELLALKGKADAAGIRADDHAIGVLLLEIQATINARPAPPAGMQYVNAAEVEVRKAFIIEESEIRLEKHEVELINEKIRLLDQLKLIITQVPGGEKELAENIEATIGAAVNTLQSNRINAIAAEQNITNRMNLLRSYHTDIANMRMLGLRELQNEPMLATDGRNLVQSSERLMSVLAVLLQKERQLDQKVSQEIDSEITLGKEIMKILLVQKKEVHSMVTNDLVERNLINDALRNAIQGNHVLIS